MKGMRQKFGMGICKQFSGPNNTGIDGEIARNKISTIVGINIIGKRESMDNDRKKQILLKIRKYVKQFDNPAGKLFLLYLLKAGEWLFMLKILKVLFPLLRMKEMELFGLANNIADVIGNQNENNKEKNKNVSYIDGIPIKDNKKNEKIIKKEEIKKKKKILLEKLKEIATEAISKNLFMEK